MIDPSFDLPAGAPPRRRDQPPRRHARLPALAAVLLLTAAAIAAAQGVRATPAALGADPTRPPLPNAAPRAQAAASATSVPRPAAAAVLPQLQALFQPRGTAEPSALVDGRLVRVGDRLGDWSVQEIGRDALWLRHLRGQRLRLALLPALEPGAASAAGTPGSAAPARSPDPQPRASARKEP